MQHVIPCARPAWSCSSVSSHAWHAPLVEFPAACHVQVMSAAIQVSARSGTRLPVALLHVTDLCFWPSSVTFSWRKQTAGTTVLHGQLWTAFLRFFWYDCLEWYAGSSAQLILISKWLWTIAENRFVPDCSGVVTARAFVAANLLIERFEMSVYLFIYYYYYYYYYYISVAVCRLGLTDNNDKITVHYGKSIYRRVQNSIVINEFSDGSKFTIIRIKVQNCSLYTC